MEMNACSENGDRFMGAIRAWHPPPSGRAWLSAPKEYPRLAHTAELIRLSGNGIDVLFYEHSKENRSRWNIR